MSVYLIRKQSGEYLDKHLEWTPIADPSQLFRTPHRDVALNQLVELNAKDPGLRASVASCEVDDRGTPQIAEPLASAS